MSKLGADFGSKWRLKIGEGRAVMFGECTNEMIGFLKHVAASYLFPVVLSGTFQRGRVVLLTQSLSLAMLHSVFLIQQLQHTARSDGHIGIVSLRTGSALF